MKLKFKVAVIMQRTIPRADGGTDQLTLVKMTPVDAAAGDVLLGFSEAELDWHPVVYSEVDRNVKIIKENNLIRSVKVVHVGQPFTFAQDGEYVLDVSEAPAVVAAPAVQSGRTTK